MKDSVLTIGSRGSSLALWQANWVRDALMSRHEGLEVRIEIIKTSGDMMRDVPLVVIGGKGAFTKEIEEALLDGRIDLAVHSLKDLPTILPGGLQLSAITEREDARDALILRADSSPEQASLDSLPRGAVVGTSSQRRMAQLLHLRKDIRIKDLRGNVDTRLRKLDEGSYDAIILASAGLRRLGYGHRISQAIPTESILSAVGQGALAVETRADDARTIHFVSPLNHEPTRLACTAERALLRALGGGCQTPIAAHAVIDRDHLRLDGLVASVTGDSIIRDRLEAEAARAEEAGVKLAHRLLELGATSLLTEMAK
ncbi:MAG TPA: hydroxymethylbilane synthase [Pyrinomonadaceae bacterium]|nr:hydroxymethylbilane synthase [Pyrinomonadaceae bacterium]